MSGFMHDNDINNNNKGDNADDVKATAILQVFSENS